MKTVHVIDAFGFYIGTTQIPDGVNQEGTVSVALPKAELQAGKQWCWNGGEWVQAFAVELQKKLAVKQMTISAYQAEVALHEAGYHEQVLQLIDDDETPARLKIAWKRGVPLQRNNPMVLFIADKLGLTDQMVDDLFVSANRITPGEF